MHSFLQKHPIISIGKRELIPFFFNGKRYLAPKGVMISSALIGNGIWTLSRHYKDNLPQGIFCANGQCAQCLILADGIPVKSCITPLEPGMKIEPLRGLPEVTSDRNRQSRFDPIDDIACDVLIIGGGPAGLSAALTLSQYPLSIIIVDDKPELGGKLTLQTHQFFGSIEDCYAGSRGTDIAETLTQKVSQLENVRVYTSSTAVAVYEDRKIGVYSNGRYFLITPKVFLNAAGAREKSLHFPGSYLPNIYGAGAFQTLLNRDLVKPASRILVVGSGNVGLIAAYHALQADIMVAAVIETLPEVSGYRVHSDKILRLGVPILTSHTITGCYGKEKAEVAQFAKVDKDLAPIPGTERAVRVDAVLIGVGLVSVNELSIKARQVGLPVFQAGDAKEVSEASAAFFGGKIAAAETAHHLIGEGVIDEKWYKKMELLKSRPGKVLPLDYPDEIKGKIQPILHCYQHIPCNPCKTVCPKDVIYIPEDDILEVPEITNNNCTGCFRCMAFCPGLAITLVKKEGGKVFSYLPYELNPDLLFINGEVDLVSYSGELVGRGVIRNIFSRPPDKKRLIVEVETEEKAALHAAGIRLFSPEIETVSFEREQYGYNPEFVCSCEHITREEIEELIDGGVTDINLMKALKRVAMGACGGKTCIDHIMKLMKVKKVSPERIIDNTKRPFLMEIKMKELANLNEEG